MAALWIVSYIRRRSKPHIPIQAVGHRRVFHSTNSISFLKAQSLRPINIAQLAGLQKFHGFANARYASVLHAALDGAVIFSGRLYQFFAFPNTMGNGLFNIDVFSRLASPYRQQCMPVIRAGDGDGIEVFVLKSFTKIYNRLDRKSVV